MKSNLLFLIAIGGAAILFAADQPKRPPAELVQLQAKVSLLEGRIAQLESRVLMLAQTPRTAFLSPAPAEAPAVPPNIGQREVNGLKVYAVPLGGTAK